MAVTQTTDNKSKKVQLQRLVGKLWDSWIGYVGTSLILLTYYLWEFNDVISY